jgi:subtilisin family serine protease
MRPAYRGPMASPRVARILGRALMALALGTAASACVDETPLGISTYPRAIQAEVAAPSSPAIPDEYIVLLKSGGPEVSGVAKQLVTEAKGDLRYVYTDVLRGFSARIPGRAVEGLRHNPIVESVSPNGVVRIDESQDSPPSWGLDRIDQAALPLSGSYSYGASGSGVNAYIIDTGIRATHQEIAGRVFPGFSAISDSVGTDDCNGHGTHVAGTVGGKTVGVAKAVSLIAVRVLACSGGGSEDGVLAGLDWVARNRVRPAVANMSLSGGLSSILNQAIANLVATGVTVAVAAGNNAVDACFFSPASAPSALTVGATDRYDTQATYSNYGACLDLYAPGSGITSSWGGGDTTYRSLNGTSMAAPHVAGAAALYLQLNPVAAPSDVAQALTANATRRAVGSIGRESPNLLLNISFMAGAVPTSPSPEPDPVTPPSVDQPPTATFSASCPRGRCTFDASASTDDKGIAAYSWDFGDGLTMSAATTSRVSHTYSVAGTFTVTLTVTDVAGQSAQSRQTVKVRKT